jgi:hypothetical protein
LRTSESGLARFGLEPSGAAERLIDRQRRRRQGRIGTSNEGVLHAEIDFLVDGDNWDSQEPGAYVDLHNVPGRVERVDQQHIKYFLDLQPGKKQLVRYSATYKRRKVGPELNTEKKRGPL